MNIDDFDNDDDDDDDDLASVVHKDEYVSSEKTKTNAYRESSSP